MISNLLKRRKNHSILLNYKFNFSKLEANNHFVQNLVLKNYQTKDKTASKHCHGTLTSEDDLPYLITISPSFWCGGEGRLGEKPWNLLIFGRKRQI